jgi:hypothetical protein
VLSSLCKKISSYETQQLILGTGTAIWWVAEPPLSFFNVFKTLFLYQTLKKIQQMNVYNSYKVWANLSLQDKTWAEFSTLDMTLLVSAVQLYS